MSRFFILLTLLLSAGYNTLFAQKQYIDQKAFDKTVKPGDDFYAYANGTWLKNNDIPANESIWGNFSIIVRQTKKNLEQLVLQVSKEKNAPGSDAYKLSHFYKSGMDTVSIEKRGIQSLKPDLERIEKINSIEDIIKEVSYQYAHTLNLSAPLFDMENIPDPIANDVEILLFGQGGMGLPEKSYYFDKGPKDSVIRVRYIDYLETLLKLSGTPNSIARQKAENVFALETQMANGSRTATENRNIARMLNYFTNDKLNSRYPNLQLVKLMEDLNIHSTKLIIAQPEFFDTVNTLLTTIPIDTWKNYLKLRLINNASRYLSSPFRNANFAFYSTAMSGVKEMKPRGETVTANTDAILGEILGKLYVEKYFTANAKNRIDALVQNVITTFGERIKSNDWMTDSTKEKALLKLSTIRRKIAYPDKWKDYSQLTIGDDYYQNVKAASVFEFAFNIAKVGKPVNRDEWGMTPPTLNAYYNPLNNEIVFPAGILLPPFFDANADDAVNYGGIATIIGHEISHGFDDQGSQFDAQGKFFNWWTKEDKDKFKEKGDQLAKQFDQYVVMDSLKVNGQLTLGENIGDLCGVTVAYQAFKKTKEGQSNNLIDGLTPDQRFFLSYAAIFRLKQRDESTRTQVLTDPHSPARFRVNGPLSNLAAFYAAFKVKEGDKLWRAPEDRVSIW